MAFKQKSGNLHSSKSRHTKKNYFATLGRKGGNVTKRRHDGAHYSAIGKKGGAKTRSKFMRGGKKTP